MSGETYPKMLYKHGDQAVVFEEKIPVDTLVVETEEDHVAALNDGWHDTPGGIGKLAYQEGGDPPTPEGGYPPDHDWNKGLAGQAGRADRLIGVEDPPAAVVEAMEKQRRGGVTLPLGNPPRHLDPSVPGPAAETEGADALKKNPGERTAKAEEEFAEQAEKAEAKRGPGRPRKTEEEKRQDDERADYGRSPADAAARSKK